MNLLENTVLAAALIAWSIAQTIKLPIEYVRSRNWDWSLMFRAGGMPSSHSALVTSTAHAIGLTEGHDSAIFALAVAISMVVIYDATGIRRQAGRQAEVINHIVRDLLEGQPFQPKKLREVLGHSPMEAIMGVVLGVVAAQLVVMYWPF